VGREALIFPRHCERSEAIHPAAERSNGLLRRFAPMRKRFAFVAGNDGRWKIVEWVERSETRQ
jgi:hypothetical protein